MHCGFFVSKRRKYVRIVAVAYFFASKLLFLNQIGKIVRKGNENTHLKNEIFFGVGVESYYAYALPSNPI